MGSISLESAHELIQGHKKIQYSATFLRELLGAGDLGRVLEEVASKVLGAVLARVQPRHHGHQRAGVLLQLALYTRPPIPTDQIYITV